MLEIIKSFFSPVGGANKLRFTEWKYTKEAISLRKLQWEGGLASR